MADEARYNGWKNHATWVVALHIDNDQPLQEKWTAAARLSRKTAPSREQVTSGIWTAQEAERFSLADRLKKSMDHLQSRVKNPLACDLIGSALADVDWHELADHYLETITESSGV